MNPATVDKNGYAGLKGLNDMLVALADDYSKELRRLMNTAMSLIASFAAFIRFWPLIVSILPSQIHTLRALQRLFPAENGYFQRWVIVFGFSSFLAMTLQLMLAHELVGTWSAAFLTVS